MAITDCPICLSTFTDPDMLPSCGHTFCRGCIARIVESARIGQRPRCPTCRQPFQARDTKPNYTLRDLLADSAASGSGAASGSSADRGGFLSGEPSAPPEQSEAQEGDNGAAQPGLQRSLTRDGEGRNQGAVEGLIGLDVPPGLAHQIMREDAKIGRRIFLLDNSGSTQMPDGHYLVHEGGLQRMQNCSRWDEIKHMAVEHAAWNAKIGTPCEFILLNPPSHPERREGVDFASVDTSSSSRQEAEQQVDTVRNMLDRINPGGVTPIADRLDELHRRISQQKQELVNLGQRVILVLVTDGLPTTASSGMSTNADKHRLVTTLRRLTTDLPVFVIVRMVTDDNSVVDYYNSVDEEIELNLEVLDDIKSEAREIQKKGNGWLVYSPVLHHIREGGTFIKLFDLLDERQLAPVEVSLLCQLLLRQPGSPPFPGEPIKFVEALKQCVPGAAKVYDPLRNQLAAPINVLQARWKMVPLSQNLACVLRQNVGNIDSTW
eukprot:CAMPEP_0115470064 /NCGR_PEP_ID=MMETSP0271-20121206/51806_1 /TAXON_ID=71861 /ORGANISM="Scrippsiella trochoidea, Strain CCMP3099" /LENGTH=490 /DNA_ID=CAMNT_0002897189 /DNA_START=62 /DNA_END=1531 /DNA_ORIENTATION=+